MVVRAPLFPLRSGGSHREDMTIERILKKIGNYGVCLNFSLERSVHVCFGF